MHCVFVDLMQQERSSSACFRDLVRLCRSNGAKDYTSEQIFQHKIMILTRRSGEKHLFHFKTGNISMNNKMNGQTFFLIFFYSLNILCYYRIVVVFRFFSRFPHVV